MQTVDKISTGTFYFSLDINLKKINTKDLKFALETINIIKIIENTTEVKKIVNKYINNPKTFSIKNLDKLNISGLEKMAVINSLLKLQNNDKK